MLEHLTAKDIPGRYKELVDNIGIEGFKYLVQMYGGTLFYVPTLEMVNKLYRNRKIRESFRGDYNETAKRFGMSRTQIYNIINEKQEGKSLLFYYIYIV